MPHISPDMLKMIILISVAIGLIECFYGYIIFKFTLALIGFIGVGGLTAGITYAASRDPGVTVLCALVGGIVGAGLMVLLYFIGIFLIGALFGTLLVGILSMSYGGNPHPAVLLIVAIICGVIALLLQKLVIIVATAFSGSWSVVTGISYFVFKFDPMMTLQQLSHNARGQLVAIIVCWIFLGLAGTLVQYKVVKLREEKKKKLKEAAKAGSDPKKQIDQKPEEGQESEVQPVLE